MAGFRVAGCIGDLMIERIRFARKRLYLEGPLGPIQITACRDGADGFEIVTGCGIGAQIQHPTPMTEVWEREED